MHMNDKFSREREKMLMIKIHSGSICCDVTPGPLLITKTRPCNIQKKILVVKMKNFTGKKRYFSYFCSKHRLWVHVRTASARRF